MTNTPNTRAQVSRNSDVAAALGMIIAIAIIGAVAVPFMIALGVIILVGRILFGWPLWLLFLCIPTALLIAMIVLYARSRRHQW